MPESTSTNIRIWQQNLNKSLISQLHLLNSAPPNDWDILALQEPWIGQLGTRSSPHWRVLYPDSYFIDNTKNPRSLILINANIPTNSYEQIHFNSPDVSGVRIKKSNHKILIINVYNDCNHNDSIDAVSSYLSHHFPNNHIPDNTHVIILGDFNRHHGWWEEDRNAHLTSTEAALQPLLDIIYGYDLRMALPPKRPTLRALSTGNWTRPDNVWCTNHSSDLFLKCDTDPGQQGPNTDHLPILSNLDIPISRNPPKPSRNFRATDWDEFTSYLSNLLDDAPPPKRINSQVELWAALITLTSSITNTIEAQVPLSNPYPHTKRWWTPELTTLRKKKNRAAKMSYRWRGLPDHIAHQHHRETSREYAKLIESTKKDHWETWLLNASERDLWLANKYTSDPPTDGGRTRMPTLNFTDQHGEPSRTTSNAEKSETLARSFFPPPPTTPSVPPTCYPQPANIFKFFSREQIRKAANRLDAYKAPGPDGIPNVILKKSIDIIVNRLYYIFRAVFELETYPDEWKESTTVVLRKPGKPSYEEPKAYRPIALLNTTGKLLSSLIADDLSHFCETREILPKTQFGGRPSRCTSDSMLLLTHSIKEAWRKGKVASVLFLDVQGAFPNVVKEVLIHNMRLRGVPTEYIKVTELILTGRKTKLSFDDFLSDFIPINNGNNQGCPLSMIYYAFYNAGLLEISPPNSPDEKQFGFVDDVALLAIGDNLTETHGKLTEMMTRPNGAFDWSISHNSQFELSKLALMNFTPKPSLDTPLTITHPISNRTTSIAPSLTYKFLGVLFDPKLKWNPQSERAARQAEAWINLVRRLARTSTGISAKGMRLLYTAVAVPKMTYAADVWFTFPHYTSDSSKKRTGSIKFIRKLTSAQRRATITMLGAMRTTAGDVLNAHAFLPPPHLLFLKELIRSSTRLASLPKSHPLHKPSQQAINRQVKRHRSPLHVLFKTTNVKPNPYETILSTRRRRNYRMLAEVDINNDRAAAIEEAQRISGTAIYTDGSGYKHGIGAAAVMVRNGVAIKTLRYYLGSDESHTVYEAEALAIILALHMACELNYRITKITIGTDNQAVLLGMKNQKSKPSHYLLDKIHDSLEDFQVTQARTRGVNIAGYRRGKGRMKLTDGSTGWKEWNLKTRSKVTFVWTPGHEGIEGNELADQAANLAAKGESTLIKGLPTFLRKKRLPISISATRQKLKKSAKLKWKGEWSLSPRFTRSHEIDGSLPSIDYIHIIEQLRRNQASLLTQFRTGHIPLNTVLHRIKRADSPDCPHCGQGFKESVFHYLLTCPHYATARRIVQAELGHLAHSIPFLLGAREAIPHFLRYVSNTGRLKSTFGEVRPDDGFKLQHRLDK